MSHQEENNLPQYYVGIGTSAGGLEALQDFVGNLPRKSGAAYIIVQHLSPDFDSVMSQLLSKHTDLEIHNAEDGMAVKVDTIYLIPPRKNMMIAEGKLILVEQMRDQHAGNFAIDIFLRSLAEDQQHRAIGIILSGTGSDGSSGIQAVKEAGGLILVQTPEDAKFDGMPKNAILTGTVDMIMPAAQMPAKLVGFITHPLVTGNQPEINLSAAQTSASLEDIFDLLRARSDIDFSQYKSTTITRRIERRTSINGLKSIEDYFALLVRNPDELDILARDMLIGVTRFFRDSEAFDALKRHIIPKILRDTPDQEKIRIWIAGCSTGEEAYSVAIAFDEARKTLGISRDVTVFATDIDSNAINEASLGQFSLGIAADVNQKTLSRYFIKHQEHYTILPEIRKMIVFATHNLLKDPPFSNCQLSVCRNVLIYFQSPAQSKILSMLLFSLNKEGYLFLGNSESLGDLSKKFSAVDERNRLFQKRIPYDTQPNLIDTLDDSNPLNRPAAIPSVETLFRNFQQHSKSPHYVAVLEKLITEYVPSCIVLSDTLDVLHVYGDVDNYTRKLKQGKFSSKVTDFIREELNIAVTTAARKALNEKKNVQYNSIELSNDDSQDSLINLRAIYIPSTHSTTVHLALIFEPRNVSLQPKERANSEVTDISEETQTRIHDLEQALLKNQESLQATVEELETANEELQSTNEELMASNEELQSTNEELQSVNEELYTVNSEYQEKIEEVTQVNLDIDNIIKSADIGFVFMDDAMLIRRFSPQAAQLINLLPSDIGRPFHHISHTLVYETLLDDISQVITTNQAVSKEVESKQSTTISVKIFPYINEHEEAMGCVLLLTDVTEAKTMRERLMDSYAELRATIESSFFTKHRNVRVLLVDDDEADRIVISNVVKKMSTVNVDYSLREASSFEQALELLQENTFDVCLIDYNLGGNTGLELISALGSKDSPPAFILLSGTLDRDKYQKALQLGIYDAVDKQELSPSLLERSIRYTLRHKQTENYLISANN
ncbi:two-component system CheB/CheR fusion protein [Alteromonadaceae bacterium 2753L.S.0a.02]|nr:two-component system CheB/CheR fusion protein [Alteromonadaceae bacterium 2753L.S.0a.02]